MSKQLTASALIGAVGISAIALTDAATVALTEEPSFASDRHGVTVPYVLSGLVHVGAYVTFALVLRGWRSQIDGPSRFRRLVRVVLTFTLAVLAMTLLIGTAVAAATGEVLDNARFPMVRAWRSYSCSWPAWHWASQCRAYRSYGSRRGRSPPSLVPSGSRSCSAPSVAPARTRRTLKCSPPSGSRSSPSRRGPPRMPTKPRSVRQRQVGLDWPSKPSLMAGRPRRPRGGDNPELPPRGTPAGHRSYRKASNNRQSTTLLAASSVGPSRTCKGVAPRLSPG